MRKILVFFTLILVFVSGCVQQTPNELVYDRCTGIVPLSYDELVWKMENNHDFLLYIGRSDCNDCREFYPLLSEYLQNNTDCGVYYLDIKAFRDAKNGENATKEEIVFFENLMDTFEIEWVPVLQHLQGDNIIDSITYLSMEYYDIKDDSEQKNAKEENLLEIYDWLNQLCK